MTRRDWLEAIAMLPVAALLVIALGALWWLLAAVLS